MNSPRWDAEGPGTSSHDNVWSSRIQWGAILAGAVAGFGTVLLMTLLGAALGVTAGTIAGHQTENPTSEDAGRAAMAFGVAALAAPLVPSSPVKLVPQPYTTTGQWKGFRSLERCGRVALPDIRSGDFFCTAAAAGSFSLPSSGNSDCAPCVGHSKLHGAESKCSNDSTVDCTTIHSSWSP